MLGRNITPAAVFMTDMKALMNGGAGRDIDQWDRQMRQKRCDGSPDTRVVLQVYDDQSIHMVGEERHNCFLNGNLWPVRPELVEKNGRAACLRQHTLKALKNRHHRKIFEILKDVGKRL